MKKLFLALLLLIPALANATVTTSFTPTQTSGVAPLAVLFDGTATTSTLYPKGTGSGYLTNGAQAKGATAIAVNTGSGTIVQSQDYISFATTIGTSKNYVVNGAVTLGATSIPLITGTGTIVAGNFVSFANDTTHKIYLVTTGIAAPGSIVITPGLGVGFTGGAALEVVDHYKYQVTGTLAAGTVTIANPGLMYDGGAASGSPVTVLPNAGNFHNIHCVTNFGDANAGTWANGTGYNTSKNYATGEIIGHVYETAGTYTATTTCRDANGTAGNTVTNTITVTDIAGANTYCISSNSVPVAGVGGCPAGASGAQQSNFATIMSTYALTGKAVLLKRGDTFTTTTTGSIGASQTGGKIGAFGTGAKPFISTSSNVNLIQLVSTTTDWRIMDLSFDGTGTTTTRAIAQGASPPSQITILRVNIANVSSAINFTLLTATPDQIAVVDSSISSAATSGAAYGIYCGICTNIMFLGNNINLNSPANTSHDIRAEGITKGVVSNNTLIGSVNGAGNTDPFLLHIDSSYVSVSDNSMAVYGSVSLNPENATSNADIHDVIVERNYFTTVSGSAGPALTIHASSVTVRNNIFNVTGASQEKAIGIVNTNTVGAPMPNRVNAYNNTVYATDASGASNFRVIDFQNNVTGLNTACHSIVQNNLAYAPNATTPKMMTVAGTCVITGAAAGGDNGNSSNAEIVSATSPFNVVPASLLDFRNIKSGTANNSTDVAVTGYPWVFDDFFHCKDKTATNFRSGAMVPTENAMCFSVP